MQTRSQSKAKNAKTPDTCSGVKSLGKTRKEIKPIVIDDIPTIINLDTKTGLDTWSQGVPMTKPPNESIRPGLEVHYTQIQLQDHYQDPQS